MRPQFQFRWTIQLLHIRYYHNQILFEQKYNFIQTFPHPATVVLRRPYQSVYDKLLAILSFAGCIVWMKKKKGGIETISRNAMCAQHTLCANWHDVSVVGMERNAFYVSVCCHGHIQIPYSYDHHCAIGHTTSTSCILSSIIMDTNSIFVNSFGHIFCFYFFNCHR